MITNLKNPKANCKPIYLTEEELWQWKEWVADSERENFANEFSETIDFDEIRKYKSSEVIRRQR